MSVSLSPNLPANVVEIGNEISQAKINEINAGTLALQTWVTSGFAPKASPTFTGTVTIPAGASISGYATQSYVTSQGYLTDAPSNGSEYVRKNGVWAVATGGGGGGSVAWGSITGIVTDQTDLTTYIGGLGYQTASDVSTYVTGLGYIAGTSASQLTNGTYTTNPTAAPTTAGDVLQFNGTALVWAASGVAWGAITGTLSTQTDLQNALDGKLSPRTVNTVSTSYTVQLTDANKIVHLSSGGMGFSITIDNDTNIPYVDGTVIFVTVDNVASGYSINAPMGSGVSINNSGSYGISSGVTTLIKVSANNWFAG